ncbi:MAG TPA: DUF882 domain-containing protein [Microvirga sp.]|nr:DUF882 domain-containing protein [Microvirga sp.]
MRVLRTSRRPAPFRAARRFGLASLAALALLVGTRGTQDAVANGDTRTLSLYHNHTRESLTVTFRRNGRYDPRALEQLNWFLRDWRRDEPTRMDPRLFDTLWQVHRLAGSNEAIHVNSAYRSPHTNSMLRRRSRGVAKNSQHIRGKAIDFYLPDVPIERIRAVGMRLQDGGVGYYPSAYTPFVHLDVGSVRAWPRMTREQLWRLFPDGKTVHIPADGEPLPRYEEARAEVLAKGGSVGGYTMVAEAEDGVAAQPRRKGFWATLFGWADEDEDAEEVRARPSRSLFAARQAPVPQRYADASPDAGAELAPVRGSIRAARAEPPPVTRIAGLPSTVQTPSGPRLEWQQGQQAPVPAGSSSVAGRAFAPMPPRRPDEIVTTGAIAFAPLPPARPGTLASGAALAAILPEPRDDAAAGASPGAQPPLPPVRPGARTIAVAAAGPVGLPSAEPEPSGRAPAADMREEKNRLRALLAEAAIAPAPRPRAPEAEPRPRAEPAAGASSVLAMGFSAAPMGDLSPNRFTGPAVKPLPVVR